MRKSKMRRKVTYSFKIVAILWRDAHVHSDEKDNLPIPVPALSFGLLIEDAPDRVTIAKELFADGEMRYKSTIPRGMVLEILPIKNLPIPACFTAYELEQMLRPTRPANWKAQLEA